MKTYTKTGDKGQTSLYSGERVSKTDLRIHAVGNLDELTSHLGKIKNIIPDPRMKDDIQTIQGDLISFMGIVASSAKTSVNFSSEKGQWLEKKIDMYSQEFTQLNQFILPGKSLLSAEIDVARTVSRRAERSLLACDQVPEELRIYINRLSDYLYTIGRVIDELSSKGKQMINDNQTSNTILLEEANQIINLIKEYASYQNCNVSIVISNKDGNPISGQSMDGSLMVAFELAIKKAYTAAALQLPTHKLGELTEEGAPFYGLENMLDKKIVTIGGGFPLIKDGKLYGAVGVSGGSADEDIDIATYGQYVWKGE